MILYAENGNYNLCLCLSCSGRWEVLPYPWVRGVVVHQNPEKNPVLAKIWSHEEGLPTQQVCCCQRTIQKERLQRSVSQKMCLPTHKVVSAICSFWAEKKISEKKTVQMREENALNYCMISFLRRKYTHGEKLLPASFSQKFPNFWWANAEEEITSNESRIIDAETMKMWNFYTGLSLLVLKGSSWFELLEIGLFTVS